MTFDHELILISVTPSENDIGDPIEIPTERAILCDVQSVSRSEHYAAAAHGIPPEIVFVVNKYEYEGEKDVKFQGNKYQVMRTYEAKRPTQARGVNTIESFDSLELICAGGVHNAGS